MTRKTVFALLMLLLALPAAAENVPIRRAATSRDPISFPFRWKGVFRGTFPQTDLRLRVFRGSRQEIIDEIKSYGLTEGACVRLRGVVVNPDRLPGRVGMPFYFKEEWLTQTGGRFYDGSFVVVFEVPPAGWIESADKAEVQALDLRVGDALRYFGNGVNFTVRAPTRAVARRQPVTDDPVVNIDLRIPPLDPKPPALPRETVTVVSCQGVSIEPPTLEIVLKGSVTERVATVALHPLAQRSASLP